MEKPEVARLVGELKGAPASVVLAMLLLGRPALLPELSTVTRYSMPTLRTALDRLSLLGFVQEEKRLGQYILTVEARQFILGETGLILESSEQNAPEEKNFFSLHVCKNVNLLSSSEEKNVLTDIQEPKNFDEDAERAVGLLVEMGRYEHTQNGRGARDSVEAALAAGLSGAECVALVQDWRWYAESKQGRAVSNPGAMAAWGLREGKWPPSYKLEQGHPDFREWYGIYGEYADVIQH